jgi:hypothetical protein
MRLVETLLVLLSAAVSRTVATIPQSAGGDAREVVATTLLREELFLLELALPPDAAKGPVPPLAVGVAALRRSLEREVEKAEWELRFFDADTRVHHVERWHAEGPRLVWREWRPGAGRTLVADVDPRGRFALVEWGREEGLRTRIDAPAGALLPLYLLELARRGELVEGAVPCFDPLSRSIERLEVELSFSHAASPADPTTQVLERRVTTRRPDGTSAGSYLFRGDELVEVRWQAGALIAKRIDKPEHEARVRAEDPSGAAALVAR